MKVLVTGIAGKIGRLVAETLVAEGHEVIGIDRRTFWDPPAGVHFEQVDVRKRAAEDVFRRHRPEAAVHMATVTHLVERTEDRYRINLGGTRAFFQYCAEHEVRRAVFVGRHTYYGAAPDSPLYHTEDEPPSAIHAFPDLADLVAADLYAGSALWRHPQIATAVLRFCYTLGPLRHGTLAGYLRGPRVPTVLGFDPLFQFMHERDVARAIAVTLATSLRGVFNVSGPQPVPLSTIVRATGRINAPVPEPLFRVMTGRFGLPELPRGAIDHLKYPIVIDSAAFRLATGFTPSCDEDRTMDDFRRAAPVA